MRAISMLLLAAGLTAIAQAQQPVELKNPKLYEHVRGPLNEIHLTRAEQEDLAKTNQFQKYLAFDIIVSPNGRVESATVAPSPFATRMKDHIEEARAIELARTFKPWFENDAPSGPPIRVKVQDYVSFLPPERWAEVKTPFPPIDDPATLRAAAITLKRTVCFGSCPDYTVTLTGDGTIHFSGGRLVAIPGDHTARLAPEAFHDLLLAFRSADFFSALDKYHGNSTDNPTQTITLTLAGRTKTIVDYVGTDDGLPLAIRNLEGQIDDTADTARWVKAEGDLVATLKAEDWAFNSPSAQNLELYATAIRTGKTPLVEQYLAAHAPIASTDPGQISPVCAASLKGDQTLVKRMVEHQSIPEAALNQCLFAAAHSGSLPVFQLWLDKGARPTAAPHAIEEDFFFQASLLANATAGGNPAILRKLLDARLDVKAEAYRDQSLLTWTLQRGPEDTIAEIVTMLASAGVDVKAHDNNGQPMLFAAASKIPAIKPMLAAGADIEARDRNGCTALIRFAYMETMVRELLADGADPVTVAKNGDTPLKKALEATFCPTCAIMIQQAIAARQKHTP